MASSGITRRIDELGRIVIPKEMRYYLGIRDGEPVEIYIEDDKVIIKKYSAVINIEEYCNELCNSVSDICGVNIIITDREKIVSTNNSLEQLKDYKLEKKHKELIDDRVSYNSEKKETFYNISGYFTFVPIITSIDCIGQVIIIMQIKSEEAKKYANIVSKLISKRIDIN